MAKRLHNLCDPAKDRYDIPRSPAVYKITNPVGKVYIGGTSNAFRRYGQYSGDSFKGQPKLFQSFVEYGKSNHTFEIVEKCDKQNLSERERYWSLYYDVINKGLNLDITGDGENKMIRSDDVLKRIGDGHRGKPPHPNCLKAMLAAIVGKKQSPEHIEKRKMFGEKNPMFGKQGYWKGKHIPQHVKDALLRVDRSGGKNGRSKKVVNVVTGEVYDCAKAVASMIGMNYATFKSKLNGQNTNNTDYKYLDDYGKERNNDARQSALL